MCSFEFNKRKNFMFGYELHSMEQKKMKQNKQSKINITKQNKQSKMFRYECL